MRRVRVLIVDDSVVVRRLVRNVLENDIEIEVVGIAANGSIALQKIPQCNPDVITLDVELPEMDGVETLKRIRETHPGLPVIMFSTLTERGASATLEALAAGATDYVTKPANVGSVQEGLKRIKEELLPKIKSLGGMDRPSPAVAARALKPAAVTSLSNCAASLFTPAEGNVSIVAIGSSTGGPNALLEVVAALPAKFPIPVLIAQHMPPLFTKLLADRLNALSDVNVYEAGYGTALEPGSVYIAPGDFHMVLRQEGTRVIVDLNQGTRENSCRPAIDPLFRSVAAVFGSRVLGVVLTGMGQDGLRGSEEIKEGGGQVIVQDKLTSVVWSMPGAVAKAGLADRILPLDQIAREIVRRVKSSVSSAPPTTPPARVAQ